MLVDNVLTGQLCLVLQGGIVAAVRQASVIILCQGVWKSPVAVFRCWMGSGACLIALSVAPVH
jgi:hypothetical protein